MEVIDYATYICTFQTILLKSKVIIGNYLSIASMIENVQELNAIIKTAVEIHT